MRCHQVRIILPNSGHAALLEKGVDLTSLLRQVGGRNNYGGGTAVAGKLRSIYAPSVEGEGDR